MYYNIVTAVEPRVPHTHAHAHSNTHTHVCIHRTLRENIPHVYCSDVTSCVVANN